MRKQRRMMMAVGCAGILSTLAVGLTACSNDAALSDFFESASLRDHLAAHTPGESSRDTATVSVSLHEFYSVQWTDFAIVCPGISRDDITAALDSTVVGDNYDDIHATGLPDTASALVLKALHNEGATRWVNFDRTSTIDLCAHNSSDTTLEFQPLNTVLTFNYDAEADLWKLG